MGLSSSSGNCQKRPYKKPLTAPQTFQPVPCFTTPPAEVSQIIPKQADVIHPSRVLQAQDFVANTKNNCMTASESSEIVKAIAAMSAIGSNITVTFFHSLHAFTEQRTAQTDLSWALDNVHFSYLKINNFQMKLSNSFEFTYSLDENKSQQTGQAILYPYFCPNQDDLFFYEIDNEHIGLYSIYEMPQRLSIKQMTCHKIKFMLKNVLTYAQYKKFCDTVQQQVEFNLQRYMADQGALLKTKQSVQLQKAQQAIDKLIAAYCSQFYDDQIYQSFIENRCLYDPYIVQFIAKIIPLEKMPGYPTQLKSNPKEWARCFWSKLLDPAKVTDLTLISYCFRCVQKVDYRTAGTNALTNRCYLEVDKKGEHPYPPFRIPETYDPETLTLPMQVRLFFDQGKVRPQVLLSLSDSILICSHRAQFYYIPIIIYLLQKLVYALTHGGEIILNNDTSDKTSGDCMSGCLNCIYNCNPLTKESHCPGLAVCSCHGEYIPDDGGISADSTPTCSGNCKTCKRH